MQEEDSGALRAAAIMQLVSGVVNLLIVSWLASVLWVTVGGAFSMIVLTVCTLGLCPLPLGSLCGFVGLVIGPLAILEIVSGIVGLSNPRGARTLMMVTAVLELLSLLVGSPVAVLAGAVSLGLTVSNK
jgi:hypothetical protein